MSRLISWEDCLARPSEGEKFFYLKDHLVGVRKKTRSFFNKINRAKGATEGCTEQWLLELAAICHDLVKAHHDWQRYVRGKSSHRPHHAEGGAILFAYLAYHYLQHKGLWEDDQYLWLLITRDLADHHGTLKGFVQNKDLYTDAFFKMDMEGLANWLCEQFPELGECGVTIDAQSIADWQVEYPDIVDEVIDNLYDKQWAEEQSLDELMDRLQQWRMLTTVIMASDRFDIEPVADDRFKLTDWQAVEESIQHFCLSGKAHPLAKIRSQAQESILEQWARNKDHSFYVLEMPTGYGKTITALKLAAAIAQDRQLSKIIYVAPYLSILEQNAEDLEKASGHKPLQHHSMALFLEGGQRSNQRKAIQADRLLDENEASDQMSDLSVQSWAERIVCTSFVQWMKAIFPRRAQETLRRIYLQDAVVIIDEPQIMDEVVWNLFLKGVASLSRLYNLTLIFCSATMPPFTYGLTKEPVKLSVCAKGGMNRYQIKLIQPLDAEVCALKFAEVEEPSSVAIVNTIYDASDLFSKLPECSHTARFLLHGLMIPLHKKIQLEKIADAMENQRKGEGPKRIQVISTQILEAGVNLSFHYMYRALPILPSLTQAAGRVNRHGEKSRGLVETGIFLRKEQDTRFIYPKNLRRLSDELLFQKEVWLEEEMAPLVTSFYQRMFAENSYQAVLEDIRKASEGNWERLSRHEVFDNKEYYRLPIFVPFDWQEDERFVPEGLRRLLAEFQVTSPWDIYELFRDKRRRQAWSYQERKRFSVLFNQFVLQVPVQKALKLVPKDDFLTCKVPLLEDIASYTSTQGLIVLEGEVDDSFI